jgi:hypothetical protein
MLIQYVVLMLLFLLPQQSNVRKEYTPANNIIERHFHSYYDYTLHWGNKQFMRALPDTFSVNGLSDPFFWNENYNYILIKTNLKQSRSVVRVLPLHETSPVRIFNEPIIFNKQTNVLAYAASSHAVKFIDLVSGKSSLLNIRPPKGSKNLVLAIKSVTMDNTALQINWVNTPESAIKVFRIPALK